MMIKNEQPGEKHAASGRRRRAGIFVLLAMCALVAGIVGVVGKYRTEKSMTAQMHAADFYVSGDCLTIQDGSGASEEVPVSGWKEGIRAELYNWEIVEGKEKITEVPVTYTYELDAASKAKGWTVSADTPVVQDNKVTQPVLLTPPAGAAKGDTVTLTVTTGPYEVKLAAIFRLTDAIVPDYTIKDMGAYAQLTLHSNNYEGLVTVSWSESFVPDVSNDLLKTWQTGGDRIHTVTVEPFTTYELIFFEERTVQLEEKTGTGTAIELKE